MAMWATGIVHNNEIENCRKEHQCIRRKNCPPHEKFSAVKKAKENDF